LELNTVVKRLINPLAHYTRTAKRLLGDRDIKPGNIGFYLIAAAQYVADNYFIILKTVGNIAGIIQAGLVETGFVYLIITHKSCGTKDITTVAFITGRASTNSTIANLIRLTNYTYTGVFIIFLAGTDKNNRQ